MLTFKMKPWKKHQRNSKALEIFTPKQVGIRIQAEKRTDNQMDSTCLSDLVKFCGVFEDVILHEVISISFVKYFLIPSIIFKILTLTIYSFTFVFKASDFSYPRLSTLEITVHQLILTYNASKSSELRNSSIKSRSVKIIWAIRRR